MWPNSLDARILLCGIMPTLTYQHLNRDAMTPNPRYYALHNAIRAMRGRDFEVFLTGVDDMITSMDSLVFGVRATPAFKRICKFLPRTSPSATTGRR